jgi:hypothetical protein
MSVPGFTAEASLGPAIAQYATPARAAPAPAGIVTAQLPPCTPGGMCFNPDVGYVCSGDCPPGTTCRKRRSIYCYRTCFLWWCWTRCEPSQIQSYDSYCDPP